MFNFFGSGQQARQQASAPTQQAQAPTTESQPTVPAPAPLAVDKYADLYQNNAGTPANGGIPEFSLDPSKVMEVAQGISFTQGMPQDLVQRVQSGDPKAFMEALEFTSRNAYAQAMSHFPTVTNAYLGQRDAATQGATRDTVRQELTTNTLSSSIPNYNNPVVKNEINRVASMYAAQHPDASPQQVAQAALEHLTALSSALNPTSGPQSNAPAPINYVDFLTK